MLHLPSRVVLCVCACVHTHVSVCQRASVCMCVRICVCLHVCAYARVQHVSVRVYTCVYACVSVLSVCVCLCAYVRVCVCVCENMRRESSPWGPGGVVRVKLP